MAGINGFDISKYDVGGTQKGDKAGDRKLTGDEARKARADGWTVWDGFMEGDSVEHFDTKNIKSALRQGIKTSFNMEKSDSYIKFKELKNKIIEQKMAEQGIYPWKHGDDNIWDWNSKEYQKAEQEADVQARKELGLSENTFDTGVKFNFKPVTSDKSEDKIDADSIENVIISKFSKKVADSIKFTTEVDKIFSQILKDKYSIDTSDKDIEEMKKLREQYKEDFETAKTQAREKTGLNDAQYLESNAVATPDDNAPSEKGETPETTAASAPQNNAPKTSGAKRTTGAKKAGGVRKANAQNKTSNTYQKTACPTIFKKGDKYYRKSNDGKYTEITVSFSSNEKKMGISSYKITKVNKDGSLIAISNKTKNGIQLKLYLDKNGTEIKRTEYHNGKVYCVSDGNNGAGYYNRVTYYDKNGRPIETGYAKTGDKNGKFGLVRNHKTGRWEKP